MWGLAAPGLILRPPAAILARMADDPKAIRGSFASQEKFDIDFNDALPRWESFSVHWIANHWRCSVQHVINLIESGELPVDADLRKKAPTKTMIRVSRKSLAEFMNSRKDLAAVAARSPAYKKKAKK